MNEEIIKIEQKLYNMELNECFEEDMRWGVRYRFQRVPGGWIYQPINRNVNGKDEWLLPCFVPYSDEFKTI